MNNTKKLELNRVSIQAGEGKLSWRIIDGALEVRLGEFTEQSGEGWNRSDIIEGCTIWTMLIEDGEDT